MKRSACFAIAAAFAALAMLSCSAGAADTYTRKQDVIYGRKYGTALTMDVFTPKQSPNGAAVVFVVSGGWVSDHDQIQPIFVSELIKHGYTVFAVVHGSQPKYTIPECISDMNRSVRFIRTRATDFGIDPNRIGISGASAGGHLSLMLGCAGGDGDPKAKDPIDRASSRVQAVACFFPPTDFLNYGEMGRKVSSIQGMDRYKPPFDFHTQDPVSKVFVPVDLETREKIARDISPIYHVTKDDAPTLIVHGDADDLVPLQQAEIMVERLKSENVPTELVVKKGGGHGWASMLFDESRVIAGWFDKYLKSDANTQAAK